MAIRIACPACKRNNSIEEDLRGRTIRCDECGGVIRVPAGGPQDDEEYRSGTKNKRKRANQSFPVVLVAILGGAGVLLVLLLVCGGGVVLLLLRRPDLSRSQQVPNIGEETQFVGNKINAPPAERHVDPAHRPVVGVLFQIGQWENVKCLSTLVPVYDAGQPRNNLQAVLARSDYAVGGLNVKTKRYVTAVQVVFMKQKPDGTLDPADQYTSNWIGFPEEADGQATLGGNGRKVIGISTKSAAVLDAVALLLE
jgi:hypothetical protein